MGLFGGWAFKYPPNTNILDVLISNAKYVAKLAFSWPHRLAHPFPDSSSVGHVMEIIVHISVYLFPIVVLLSRCALSLLPPSPYHMLLPRQSTN